MDCRAVVFTFFIISFASVKYSYQLHEFMTDDEIQAVFQATRDSVPPYEVVPVVHTMNSKNVTNPELSLNAFNVNMSFYLWPAEGLLFGKHTPIYTVEADESSPQGLRYTKYSEYGLYYAHRDGGNFAAIIIRRGKNNNYKFDGAVGKNLIIRSLPQRIIDDIINKNLSLYEPYIFPNSKNTPRIYTLTDHHVVFKVNLPYYRFRHNISVIDNSFTSDNRVFSRNKPTKPILDMDTVYPEILVILDYDTFRYFRSDISETLIYLAAFWNGVDLRYRSLNNPKIHLNLAMIVIALDKKSTPYLNKYRVNDNVISTEALKAVGQYLYTESRLNKNSYDIAIVITRLEICQWPIERNDRSNCVALRGISKFGSACAWSDTERAVEALAFVHDEGFNGIATAAHELGHILGVPHDGSTSARYVGGPGATKCNWGDGYLMSSNRFSANAFEWSDCSSECFKYFLRQSAAKCLYNKPKLNTALPRIMPGKLLSLDEQCVEAGALDACYHDERACILLYCTKKDSSDKCIGTAPAAEGSTCGHEKICIRGKCIRESQWKSL